MQSSKKIEAKINAGDQENYSSMCIEYFPISAANDAIQTPSAFKNLRTFPDWYYEMTDYKLDSKTEEAWTEIGLAYMELLLAAYD